MARPNAWRTQQRIYALIISFPDNTLECKFPLISKMSGSSDVSPHHDGDLLYLTDTAYFALLDHESGNRRIPSKDKNKPDGLFLERLESFLEGQQKEMKSFASREQRSFDEVNRYTTTFFMFSLLMNEKIRKLVAIPHARYIFSLDPSLPQPGESSEGDLYDLFTV